MYTLSLSDTVLPVTDARFLPAEGSTDIYILGQDALLEEEGAQPSQDFSDVEDPREGSMKRSSSKHQAGPAGAGSHEASQPR